MNYLIKLYNDSNKIEFILRMSDSSMVLALLEAEDLKAECPEVIRYEINEYIQ